MNRLLRSCFTKSGKPKARFTKDEAKTAALRLKQRSYFCEHCDCYHLASKSR
jgi:hypothetical protein